MFSVELADVSHVITMNIVNSKSYEGDDANEVHPSSACYLSIVLNPYHLLSCEFHINI